MSNVNNGGGNGGGSLGELTARQRMNDFVHELFQNWGIRILAILVVVSLILGGYNYLQIRDLQSKPTAPVAHETPTTKPTDTPVSSPTPPVKAVPDERLQKMLNKGTENTKKE